MATRSPLAVLRCGRIADPRRAAPRIGQHSHQVLVAELGVTEAEYADLVAAGVTGTLYGG